MSHLHEAIDFRAAFYSCFAHGGAIDAGETLNLDVILDHRDAGLHNLELRAIGSLGETEAIAADDHAVLENDAVADPAEFTDHGVGVGQKVISNLHTIVENHVGM